MKVGTVIMCTHCGKAKAPRGRSVPDLTWDQWCQGWLPSGGGCIGYTEEPRVGDLWPDESERDFGYPVIAWGTKEVPDE